MVIKKYKCTYEQVMHMGKKRNEYVSGTIQRRFFLCVCARVHIARQNQCLFLATLTPSRQRLRAADPTARGHSDCGDRDVGEWHIVDDVKEW